MNQAQRRRLRMRCLLLLAPLLVAGTPSPFSATRGLVLAAAPTHLAFLPLPLEITKGRCVPITVEARDSSGAPASPGNPVTIKLGASLMGGTYFASNTCQQSAISSVVLPGNAERAQMWFKAAGLGSLMLTASDGLFGMIDALSVPLSVVVSPTERLAFDPLPPAVMAGQPINITVRALTGQGFVATGYAGTIRFTSMDRGAVLPQDYTFNPSVDAGIKTFSVVFGTGGTWNLVAEDVSNENLRASAASIPVRAEAATSLEIAGLPSQAFRGTPLTFHVLALDANGAPGAVRGNLLFRSDDASASLPPDGPLQPSYTVTFNSTGPTTLSVTDSTGSADSFIAPITIMDAQARSVAVTPSFAQKRTCENATLTLAVTDGLGPMSVSLCRDDGHAAIPVVVTNFTNVVMTDRCVTGSFEGSAEVEWVSKQRDEVPFKVYGATTSNQVMVSWRPEPDPELTSFDFLSTSEEVPKLPVATGEHKLQLQLSDTCPEPKPLALPPGVISFEASPGLSLSSSNADTPGRWVISVTLPECPADPTQALAIWPTLNGRELTRPDGGRLEQLVQPKCPPIVELSISGPGDGERVQPGGLVELEVELSNKGQVPVVNGLLMVSAEGLDVLEARLAGESEPLTPHEEGFIIPELLPGAKVKVKLKAQATTNLQQEMNAKVRYVDANGNEITQPRDVGLGKPDPGVDVGCGCHAASLPGQLFPWLALLLAASRPWDRSRRLRRGERIDR